MQFFIPKKNRKLPPAAGMMAGLGLL